MAIQNIRTWQWMFIGIVVGLLFALAWNFNSSDGDAASSWSVSRFADRLRETTEQGNPVLTNIVIDPMIRDGSGKEVQRVHFTLTARNKNTGNYDPYEDASIVVIMPMISDKPDYRIQDYIKDQQKNNPLIKYQYAWWKLTSNPKDREAFFWQNSKYSWFALAGVGFVVVGVIWPMVIKTLIKIGLVPEPDVRPDLSQVKNVKNKTREIGSGKKVTADDMRSLDALNEKLESEVGDMLIKSDQRDEAAERKKEEAVIKKLENMPLEQQQVDNQNDEPKEYQGEFYPVVKPHHDEKTDKKH